MADNNNSSNNSILKSAWNTNTSTHNVTLTSVLNTQGFHILYIIVPDTLSIIYIALGSFGFFVNMFTVLIIASYKPMHKHLTNTLIANQSLVDAALGAFLLLTTIFQNDMVPRRQGNILDEALCRLWFAKVPMYSMLISSAYGIVAVAFERFLAVVHPLWHRAKLTRRQVGMIIVAVWLIGPLYVIPLSLGVSWINDEGLCSVYDNYKSAGVQYFSAVFSFFFEYAIPIISLGYLYMKMILALHVKQSLKQKQQGEQKLKQQPVAGLNTATANLVVENKNDGKGVLETENAGVDEMMVQSEKQNVGKDVGCYLEVMNEEKSDRRNMDGNVVVVQEAKDRDRDVDHVASGIARMDNGEYSFKGTVAPSEVLSGVQNENGKENSRSMDMDNNRMSLQVAKNNGRGITVNNNVKYQSSRLQDENMESSGIEITEMESMKMGNMAWAVENISEMSSYDGNNQTCSTVAGAVSVAIEITGVSATPGFAQIDAITTRNDGGFGGSATESITNLVPRSGARKENLKEFGSHPPLDLASAATDRSTAVMTTQQVAAPAPSRKVKDTTHRARRNLIKTLIIVGVASFVMWTWRNVWDLMFFLGDNSLNFTGNFFNFIAVMDFGSCCINPIIYCILYSQFQAGVREIFCRYNKLSGNRIGNYSTDYVSRSKCK